MSAHTPGPWAAVNNNDMYWQINDAEGRQLVDALASWFLRNSTNKPEEEEDWATSEANARLIAAAPELLAALRDLAEHYSDDRYDPLWSAARAAIAKAAS